MKCTDYDFTAKYEDCVNGQRKVSYNWNDPLFCDKEKIDLQLNNKEACEKCVPGQYLVQTQGCSYCQQGL